MNEESPEKELSDKDQILEDLRVKKIFKRLRLEGVAKPRAFSIREILVDVVAIIGAFAIIFRYGYDLRILMPYGFVYVCFYIRSNNTRIHKRVDAILELQELEAEELKEKSEKV